MSKAKQAFITGMQNADSKGYAAGQDPQFREQDNPYQRYEHRLCWLTGFRRAREGSATNTKGRGE